MNFLVALAPAMVQEAIAMEMWEGNRVVLVMAGAMGGIDMAQFISAVV